MINLHAYLRICIFTHDSSFQQTKSEKELMRPLYDRYRQIKKALATAPISKPEAKVGTW